VTYYGPFGGTMLRNVDFFLPIGLLDVSKYS